MQSEKMKVIKHKKTDEVIVPDIGVDFNKKFILRKKIKELTSVPELVAGDIFFYVNHSFEKAAELFPDNKKMQYCDKYFPYAEGGPLYIDELNKHSDLDEYLTKEKIMLENGLRYLLIKPGMNEQDCMVELCGRAL